MRPLAFCLLGLLVAGAGRAAGAPEPPPEAVLAALPFAATREPNRVMVDLASPGARPFVLMLDIGASDSGRALPVKVVASRVLVPIEVKGQPLEVLLDTGAPSTGVISGQAARAVGIDVASLPAFGATGTVIGRMQTSLYEEPAFGLAGFTLGLVPVLVAPRGWYNMGAGNDSVIGYDVLAPFVVRIDYPRQRLWLKRAHADPIRFGGADYALARQTGAFTSPEAAGHRVWAVRPGSPADALGVRAGDIIVSSDRAEAPPPDEVLRRILEGKELQVARWQGELWVDTVLPEPPPAP